MRRPKKFEKSPPYFWLALQRTNISWRFRKILWPSENRWTLITHLWFCNVPLILKDEISQNFVAPNLGGTFFKFWGPLRIGTWTWNKQVVKNRNSFFVKKYCENDLPRTNVAMYNNLSFEYLIFVLMWHTYPGRNVPSGAWIFLLWVGHSNFSSPILYRIQNKKN